MARDLIIIIAVVLSVTTHARTQYIDFFQSFSTFIQPYSTTRRPDVTKRPTNKQTNKRYQDTIFFETDDFLKQRQNGRSIDPYTTTNKPRKLKTTRKPTTSQERKYNQINNEDNNIFNYAFTTQKPYYVAQMIPNHRTTINPLLYRPGVRPAVVDDNRPPITNRPVTNRPVTNRPVTNRPKEEAEIEIGPDEDDMSEAEKRRFIQIAEQKCEEYKSFNKKKIVALPLASVHHSPGVELEVNTCAPNTAPLIIGGQVVGIKQFPHMGLVGWKNIQKSGYSWKCGGSLVSEQYMLTAGHCTYHEKDYNVISGPPSAVQLGSSYIDGRDALVVTISSVIRHPKYKARRSYHDVALIKLETTVKFSESISPACIGVPPPVGNRVITTGWGRTEFVPLGHQESDAVTHVGYVGSKLHCWFQRSNVWINLGQLNTKGGDSSQELRGVSVPIWDMNECRTVWGTSRKLPDGPSAVSQLCAGDRNGGKDTCQGDSGGPAQIQDGCTWRVVAVTSVGRSCGAAETPALYAKIPRAFIAAEIFSNVKINNNNNNRYNENNNQGNKYNVNNNQGDNNNRYNEHNNQDANRYNENNNSDEVRRPSNHQSVGNDWSTDSTRPGNHQTGNNWSNSNTGLNRPVNHQTINRVNQQSTDNRPGNQETQQYNSGVVDGRPGNHQTVGNHPSNHQSVGNDWSTDSTRPGNHQNGNNWSNSNTGLNRPVNHQTINRVNQQSTDNRPGSQETQQYNSGVVDGRPGNHQTVSNHGNQPVNHFVTSQTGNRETDVRLGNHQTVDSNFGEVNYFVTSHINDRETGVSRLGNHQMVENSGTPANYFITSQTTGNRDNIGLPGNHQRLNNAGNRFSDSQNSESSQDSVYQHNENNNANKHYNNYGVLVNNDEHNHYNNQNRNSNTKTTQTSNYGYHNSDTTESVAYNNNNGYNANNNYNVNNRGFAVANRPWWNR